MYGLLNKIMDTWLNGYMVKWLCVGVSHRGFGAGHRGFGASTEAMEH